VAVGVPPLVQSLTGNDGGWSSGCEDRDGLAGGHCEGLVSDARGIFEQNCTYGAWRTVAASSGQA